jgi:hypothetical protein
LAAGTASIKENMAFGNGEDAKDPADEEEEVSVKNQREVGEKMVVQLFDVEGDVGEEGCLIDLPIGIRVLNLESSMSGESDRLTEGVMHCFDYNWVEVSPLLPCEFSDDIFQPR